MAGSQDQTSTSATGFASLEQLLSAIINSTDDAIISKNLNGIITSWNAAAEKIFGYTASEAIGRSITMLIPTERLDEETTILSKVRRGERIEHFDTKRLSKDGRLLDISVTVSPIKNPEGVVVGASKIARDISRRKLAEETDVRYRGKLEIINQIGVSLAAERDLQKLVQAITDAGTQLSGAAFGAFFYNTTNAEGEAFMLYTLSGAPKEAFERFGMPRNTPIFGPTFGGKGIVRLADVTADSRYGQMPPHHGMPKGHLPVRSYLAAPVISRNSDVIGGLFFGHPEVGVFTEESEGSLAMLAAQAAVAIDNSRLYSALEKELESHKVMERALRESESLSSSVLDSSADCITTLNPAGRLLSMNPAGLEAFHATDFAQLKGHTWAELWPSETRDTVKQILSKAAQGATERFHAVRSTHEGVPTWWDVIVTPVHDADGKISRLTAIARDISEQRRASDEAFAASAEAERQSRIKDEFLATLSHELRTPLQSILGWTQLLMSDASDEKELKEGLEVIDRNAQAQNRIIEDLLDMSRILSGKVRLDVQQVHLSSVIEAAMETVRPSANAKEIRLQSILDPLAQPVSGDPSRLQQVFWNLLSNAIKFTPRGGRVQVLLERVNSHLEVTVNDTGMGISAEFLPHMFERFRQADSSSTRRHAGLGLGLAIVKHLAELHGGSIRAKSAGQDQGSSFIVSLPLAALHLEPEAGNRRHPLAPASDQAILQVPRLDGLSILVVDDEEDARMLIARMLAKAGCEVRTAGSVREGLKQLREKVPSILISDIGMPDQDGYSLIRELRSWAPEQGGRIPAIALTAYTRTEDRIRSMAEGFQVHLSKPANALELLTVVRSLSSL